MIETASDLARFQLENQQGDWIVHIVPENPHLHSAISTPSVLFVRNILTGRTYYYSFNHPDSRPEIKEDAFREILRASQNKKWALDKKSFCHMVDTPNVCDVNLVGWMKENEIVELSEFDTPAHYLIRKNAFGNSKINSIVPLMKHLEAFNDLADTIIEIIKDFKPDTDFTQFNDLILGTLGDIEKQGIFVDREMFKEKFNIDPGPSSIARSQYNVYTSTGRPSNRYANVNYMALNHRDGTRKCFRSRYGKDGAIVVLDYTAFHPRIIAYLTNYNIPVTTDVYEYLAKLYFQKREVDETDIKNAKTLTFRQVYGGVEDKYSHIKYLSNLKKYIDEQWGRFKSVGYVLTPFLGRQITNKHVLEPSPNKVFNYILQGAEGELSIPKVKTILDYLQGKQTKVMLYIYDAVLLDFHKDDGIETLRKLRNIMSFDGRFPIKVYMGETYHDVKLLTF